MTETFSPAGSGPEPEAAAPKTASAEASSPDAGSGTPPGALSRGAQRLVLTGMVALCSLGAFEALAVATAMPTIAVDLNGLRHYTLAFAVVFATSVVGMLAAGRWCDRAGPAPAMWTGMGLFVVGLTVAGTATGMGALIAGRAVQGIGSGLFGVALYVLIARVFSADRHPAVFSALATAWVVPAIVGPALAGLVVDHLGWRWVILGAAVLTAPAAFLMYPGLTAAQGDRTRAVRTGADRRADRTSAEPNRADPTSTDDGPADREPGRPLLDALRLALSVLRAGRGLPAVVSVRALVSGAFTGAEVLLPLLLVHERHLSPGGAGLILSFGALGWSAASWVRGRNLLRLSHTGYVRLGGGLLGLGMVGAALLVLPDLPAGVGMAFWVLSGTGMGLVYPTLSILTLELAAPHEQGSASSALQVADAVAAALAASATGTLLWALYDVAGLPAYAVVLGLTATLALGALLLASRTRAPGVGVQVPLRTRADRPVS
ncbi:MFS transporter [Promicromonospora sp. Populi]|uniref:MFS transporter n=1 Tax=Promicromonospora sp. Populi TaxID=3239420 RepID=UPI0034E2D403